MKQARVIITLLLLGYILVAVSWARNREASELCAGISIDSIDSRFVTTREVLRELGDLPERACSLRLHQINTDSIERMLSAIDKIEKAKCLITSDRRIHVRVTPMEPVARVFEGRRSYYLNRAGKRISADARYHSDVPVVSGNFDSAFTAASLLPLITHISADSTWSTLVTHIKADGPRDIILIPMIRGHVINLGDADNLESKFRRLRRAYREVLPVKGWDYYDTLSLKWEGQLVATRRRKKLHETISTLDFEAEQEAPDIGTMTVDTTAHY